MRNGWHIGRVWAGAVILRETRICTAEAEARRQGERWMAKYLETGAWNKATEWHEKNFF